MRKYLLSKKGEFYKANLHIHTTVSDGKMTPEETKKAYLERGYSVVAFTDHEIMLPHSELTDDNFLALTSTEISINQRSDCDFRYTKTYHLNIFSPEENKSAFNSFDRSKMWLVHSFDYITEEQKSMEMNRTYESVNDVIKKANDEGCLVSYNHPVWSLQDYNDYIDLNGLWAIEVFNNTCTKCGYPDSAKPFDDLLRVGKRVFPLATDDAHSIQECFGGFVMISANDLKYESIFSALKSGDFYASTGPQINEISIEDGVVSISTSPVSFVCVSTDIRHTYFKWADSQPLTEVDLDIKDYLRFVGDGIKDNRYIRITVTDQYGKSAYSRAYFIDEIL